MKVTYTIWISKDHHYTAERTLDSYNEDAIRRAFEDALDLSELRYEKAMRESAARKAETKAEEAMLVDGVTRAQMQANDGPHKSWEYDGAFWCTDCGARWGALPGKPEMPAECKRVCCTSRLAEDSRVECDLLKGHSGPHNKSSGAPGGFVQWENCCDGVSHDWNNPCPKCGRGQE
jgi:hypothetical protein